MKLPSGRSTKQLRAIFARYRRLDQQMADRGYRGPSGRRAVLGLGGSDRPGIPEELVRQKPWKYMQTPAGNWIPRYGGSLTYEGRKGLADRIRAIRATGRNPTTFEKRMARFETMMDAMERRFYDRHRALAKTRRKQRIMDEKKGRLRLNREIMRRQQIEIAKAMGEI